MKPDARLEAAIDFIENSRIELAEGKFVMLDGFQHKVKEIHDMIAAMPKDEAKIYTPSVEKLFDGLKTLESELVAQQHKLQQEIFALNRKQKALKSYQTSNYSSGEDSDGN